MIAMDLFSMFYDIFAYLVAASSLIDEILYKLGFKRRFNLKEDIPNLTGNVAVVTGGTRGLGLTVVRALVSKGCCVFVASSQSKEKFSLIKKKIYDGITASDFDTSIPRGEIHLHHLDLSSLDSVKSFIDAFRAKNSRLNFLICNAGIMFAPRSLTYDGLESHFEINYLGHSLIILELLDMMKRTADETGANTRILSVSSSTHRITKFRFDDLKCELNYSSSQAYAQSKLAQIMFTSKLSRVISTWGNVFCYSLHPGVVLSDLYEHVHLIKYFPFLIPIIKLVTRNMIQGAETTLFTALSNEISSKSGAYLEDCAIKPTSARAQNLSDQERLWDLTLSILKPYMQQAPKTLKDEFRRLNN